MNYSPREKADKCDIFKVQSEDIPYCSYIMFHLPQRQGSGKGKNERKSVRETQNLEDGRIGERGTKS